MELFEQPPPLPVPPISSSPSNNNTNNIKPAKEIDRIDIALLQRLEQSINKDLSLSLPSNQSTVSKTTTKARRHCQTQTTETYITDTSSVLIDYQKNDSNNSSSYNHHSQQQQQLPGITVEQLEKQIADEKRRQKRLQAVMKESTDKFEVLSGLAYMKLRELWEEKMRWEEAYFTLNERLDEVQQQQQQQGTHNSSQEVSIPIVPGASLHPPPAQSI
ncbi:hypothetical protein BDC45DRAFT_505577 [Circinella umbellata]|nr:hypothetical protein BDC45DRAFT_505577 [Circinella umbellata]